jgi:hypothetical protein
LPRKDEYGLRDAPLGGLLGLPNWPFLAEYPEIGQEIEGAAYAEHEALLAMRRGDAYECDDGRQLAEQYRRAGGYA